MLDPQILRTDPEGAALALQARQYELDVAAWRALEQQRKDLQVRLQELQNRKNHSAREIGQAKARGEDIQPLLDEVGMLGDGLTAAEAEFAAVRARQLAWAMEMPNLALPEVPVGNSDADNREVRRWGEPPAFDFAPRDHVELGERNGLLDAESAARLAGARFTVLRGALSRMHRALAQFMLDRRARLQRGLPAVPGERGNHDRHRPVAEVRRGRVRDHRRTAALPGADGRGADDQPGGRPDPGSG
jgi:seryl-tRNA synthetase